MIGRMPHRNVNAIMRGFLPLLIAYLTATASPQEKLSGPNPFDHGTVNVIVANSNGLVAATDSMLTDPNGHYPIGTKLFKLDDQTVATMAGQYSLGFGDLVNFAMFVPRVMERFRATNFPGMKPEAFEKKISRLTNKLEFELTVALKAAMLNHPLDIETLQPLYVTVAGYDLDGKLKIAQISLHAVPERVIDDGEFTGASAYVSFRRPLGSNPPPCEQSAEAQPSEDVPYPFHSERFTYRTMGNFFYCDVAGIPQVAERILGDPASSPTTVIRKISEATIAHPLSLDELTALATALVEETANDPTVRAFGYVGGPVQIAVLANGKVQSFTGNPNAMQVPTDSGTGLSNPQYTNLTVIHCSASDRSPIVPVFGKQPVAQVHLEGCTQSLDGIVFQNSTFVNSILTFAGHGKLLFADSNKVVESELQLDPSVVIDPNKNPILTQLLCRYSWKAVLKGSKEVKFTCPSN